MAKVWRAVLRSQDPRVSLIENVLHYSDSEPVLNPASASDVAGAINSHFATDYRQLLSLGAVFISVDVREELAPGDTSVPEAGSHSNGSFGTRDTSDNEVSPAMCALISKHTNAAVRGARGRFFCPPVLRASELDGGGFDPSGTYRPAAAAVRDLIADTLTGVGSVLGVGGSTLTPVVYSRTRRARGDASYFFAITSCDLSSSQHWLESRES